MNRKHFLWCFNQALYKAYKPRHDKNNKMTCAPKRRLRSPWTFALSNQSSLSAWRKVGFLTTHWAHSEDSDPTGHIPTLIWVAGRTCHFVGFVILPLISWLPIWQMFCKKWIGSTNATKRWHPNRTQSATLIASGVYPKSLQTVQLIWLMFLRSRDSVKLKNKPWILG